MIRVVLDSNIFISLLISREKGKLKRLYALWRSSKFINYISLISLRELVDVVSRSKIQDKAGIEIEEIKNLLREVVDSSVLIKPLHRCPKVLDDEEDQVFLEMAATAKAHYIVSGDKGLLKLGEYQASENQPLIKIISVSEFLEEMEKAKKSKR